MPENTAPDPAARFAAMRAYADEAHISPTMETYFGVNHHFSGLLAASVKARFPTARYVDLIPEPDDPKITCLGDVLDADLNIIQPLDDPDWQNTPIVQGAPAIILFVWELDLKGDWARDGIETVMTGSEGRALRIDIAAALAAPLPAHP